MHEQSDPPVSEEEIAHPSPLLPPPLSTSEKKNAPQPATMPKNFLSPTQEDLLPGEEDMPFEEELLRNPFSVKTWCRYLASRGASTLGGAGAAEAAALASPSSTPGRRRVLFERALKALPGSYKLWFAYLTELKANAEAAEGSSSSGGGGAGEEPRSDGGGGAESDGADTSGRPFSPRARDLAAVFERSLVTMHKMPAIWKLYLEHLAAKCSGLTRLRRALDAALRALPLAQHERWIWPLALARLAAGPETPLRTAAAVYRRYLLLKPGHVEEYVAFLESRGRFGEAARRLASQAVDDDAFVSVEGASRHQLWLRLAELVTKHPREAREAGLDADSILRAGIRAAAAVAAAANAAAAAAAAGGGAAPAPAGAGGGGGGGQGRLWCALADHHIRCGSYEAARSVLEEGMGSVTAVSDFALVFDSLAQFEESLIAHRLGAAEAMEGVEGGGGGEGGDGDARAADEGGEGATRAAREFLVEDAKRTSSSRSSSAAASALSASNDDLDLRLARLEHLTQRRPLLLSAVALRQNPHSVSQWHRRARLLEGDPAAQIRTYTQAVAAVDPLRASGGRVWTLWAAFARVYEDNGDPGSARVVFAKALGVELSGEGGPSPSLSYSLDEPARARLAYADDAARLWCAWAEGELRAKRYSLARAVLRLATARPPAALFFAGRTAPLSAEEERDPAVPPSARAYRSLRLWSMRCDVEESLGTCDDAARAYEGALDLRVASAQLVLNFAAMLLEHNRFEAAFRAYERGTQLFKYPAARDVWNAYLKSFIDRYEAGLRSSSAATDSSRERERARDLLRCALAAAPPAERADLYLQASSFEEKHGPPREAVAVLEKGVLDVPNKGGGRRRLYDALLAKSSLLFGVSKVREVFEAALERDSGAPGGLPDLDALQLARQWAALEGRLGEVDRARAVYAHASSLADPSVSVDFWDAWNAFEVSHGNEDTFREALRCRRAVRASFAGAHVPLAAAGAAAAEASFRAGAAVAAAVARAAAVAASPARGGGAGPEGAMAALEAAAAAAAGSAAPAALAAGTAVPGFVSGGTVAPAEPRAGLSTAAAAAAAAPVLAAPVAANPDEIDIGDEDFGGADDDGVVLETKAVPAAVFGSAAQEKR